MAILDYLSFIGEWVSTNIAGKLLKFLNDSGVLINVTTAKAISILFYLFLIWVVITFLGSLKKPVKIAIIILLGFVTLSILISLVT